MASSKTALIFESTGDGESEMPQSREPDKQFDPQATISSGSNKSVPPYIMIPSWVIALIKVGWPALGALVFMYVQFGHVQEKVGEHDKILDRKNDEIQELKQKMIVQELNHKNLENNVVKALSGIESAVKDIQKDVKEMRDKKQP